MGVGDAENTIVNDGRVGEFPVGGFEIQNLFKGVTPIMGNRKGFPQLSAVDTRVCIDYCLMLFRSSCKLMCALFC